MAHHLKVMAFERKVLLCGVLVAMGVAQAAYAETWSDTYLSYRYGTAFAEPYDNTASGAHKNISKNIFSLTHVGGYTYGTHFFNVDYLLSDRKDPADGVAGKSGAQEAYAVYRNTLDFSKVFNKNLSYGVVRSVGATGGFDLNTKNDGYGSRKRMAVVGPTLMFNTPGFVNLSALALFESNSPNAIDHRYTYKTHPAVELDWGVPIGSLPLSFAGYALWIASKGNNEFHGPTAPETHVDAKLMYDIGSAMNLGKNTLQVGGEYEYWHNKFGNPTTGDSGATARTPMVRVEYHF
jgi:nucleoside-specific outer membrane channel protein Tsx